MDVKCRLGLTPTDTFSHMCRWDTAMCNLHQRTRARGQYRALQWRKCSGSVESTSSTGATLRYKFPEENKVMFIVGLWLKYSLLF